MTPQSENDNPEKDKGGRILAGKKWRVFNFVVEVAVESPKGVDQFEALEDAEEFMSSTAHTMGRVHESFASITRVDYYGPRAPRKELGQQIVVRSQPTGPQAKDNAKPIKKAKPKKKQMVRRT